MPHEGQTGVYFDSAGNRLLGTLFLAKGDEPKPTAIVMHGLPGIEKNHDLCHALRASDWNALVFHYRGSWGSGGDYRFDTLPEDARAALDYLSSGAHESVDARRMALVGHSMGGWTALMAGADERVCAVATIGAVTDPARLPFDAGMAQQSFTPFLEGITPTEFEEQWAALGYAEGALQRAAGLSSPLLIAHAKADEVVPVEQAQLLHEAGGGRARIELHPDANHAFVWHRAWLVNLVVGWLHEVVPVAR
jgi:dienelactone hydrolase